LQLNKKYGIDYMLYMNTSMIIKKPKITVKKYFNH